MLRELPLKYRSGTWSSLIRVIHTLYEYAVCGIGLLVGALAFRTKIHFLFSEKMHPRADVVCLTCNVRFCRHLIGAGPLHSSLGPALLSSALRYRLHRTSSQGAGVALSGRSYRPGFRYSKFSETCIPPRELRSIPGPAKALALI